MENWWEAAPVAPQSPVPQGQNWWDAAPVVEQPAQPGNNLPADPREMAAYVASTINRQFEPAAGDFGKPPPGVIIHGKDRDYISDRPDLSVSRTTNDGGSREQAVRQQALLLSQGLSQGMTPTFQGVSMGWGDEAVSQANAAIAAAQGKDPQAAYDVSQEAQRQAFEREREQHPYRALAGQVGGGALTAVAASPFSALARGGGISRTVGAATLDGLLQGAVTGSGSAENGNRAEAAGQGALWGGGLGFGAGLAAPVIGKGVQAARNYIGSFRDPALAGVPRAAREYAAGLVTNPQQATDLLMLGPQGMLADVSPQWFGVARAAAARPGSREAVVNALLDRQAGSNARLGADLDAALGPRVIPSQVEGGLAAGRQAVARDYGPAFANARAVNTEPLAANLETNAINLRGPAQQAVQRVRGMLDVTGVPGQLDPNPGTLFQTRQAIDGMLAGEQNPQVIRQLTMARQQVDAELARAVPGIKDVDARFAELARQSEGLQRGGQVLDAGKTAIRPEELAQEIAQGAAPQGTMVGPSAVPLRMQQGARAEIDRVVGNNANDATAWGRLVRGEGDWNRDKLRVLFGNDAADAALAAGDREATFRNTAQGITQNSHTQLTNEFGKMLDQMGRPAEIPASTTVLGGGLSLAKKGLDTLRNNAAERNAARFAQDLGNLSVATGSNRDRLVQALMQRAADRSAPLSPGMQAVIDALLGTRQGAVQELSRSQ